MMENKEKIELVSKMIALAISDIINSNSEINLDKIRDYIDSASEDDRKEIKKYIDDYIGNDNLNPNDIKNWDSVIKDKVMSILWEDSGCQRLDYIDDFFTNKGGQDCVKFILDAIDNDSRIKYNVLENLYDDFEPDSDKVNQYIRCATTSDIREIIENLDGSSALDEYYHDRVDSDDEYVHLDNIMEYVRDNIPIDDIINENMIYSWSNKDLTKYLNLIINEMSSRLPKD